MRFGTYKIDSLIKLRQIQASIRVTWFFTIYFTKTESTGDFDFAKIFFRFFAALQTPLWQHYSENVIAAI
jgi:hypothetical protein